VSQAVVFLPFHAPILEPDFDLSFSKTQLMGNFNPTSSRQISIVMELFLQFQRLVSRVRRARPLSVSASARTITCHVHSITTDY